MSIRERVDDADLDRRLLLLVVLFLVLLGSGVGTVFFTDFPGPSPGNETTPTPAATATTTPGGPGQPSETETSTDGQTPVPTPTDTATPVDAGPGAGGGSGDDGGSDGDENDGGGGAPATPSSGLELGDDRPLMHADALVPGESGQGALTVRNTEDENGNLTITAVDIVDLENGFTDPERGVDSTPDVGELSSHLEVRLSIRDGNGNEEYLLGTDGGYVRLEDLPDRTPSAEYPLASGEAATLVADWRLPESTGNEIQSDSVEVTLGLLLESADR